MNNHQSTNILLHAKHKNTQRLLRMSCLFSRGFKCGAHDSQKSVEFNNVVHDNRGVVFLICHT